LQEKFCGNNPLQKSRETLATLFNGGQKFLIKKICIMKKRFLRMTATVVMASVIVTACGGTKQVAQSQPRSEQSNGSANADRIKAMKEEAALVKAQQELDDAKAGADRAAKQREADAAIADQNAKSQAARAATATEQPCQLYDDADWFTATGVRRVQVNSVNIAATALLRTTKQQLLLKLKGTYKAVVRDYFDQMDMEEGSYAVSHIESAGDLIINQKVNDTYEACRKDDDVKEPGWIWIYMGIKVSKKEIVDEVVKEISKDKKLEVRFQEKNFRDSAFKVFEKEQKEGAQKFQESQSQQ
jgi:hypothetical protein